MKEIARFKGQNGIIIVNDDSLEISRQSFGGFIAQGGFVGNRIYNYEDISSIEYRKPTLLANGYFKIIVQGTNEVNAKVDLLGSSLQSMQDQNTVVLRAFSKKVGEETDRIYQLILEKLKEHKNKTTNQGTSYSKMDELKKLGELKESGILTEEEFQKEKEKLLNK